MAAAEYRCEHEHMHEHIRWLSAWLTAWLADALLPSYIKVVILCILWLPWFAYCGISLAWR